MIEENVVRAAGASYCMDVARSSAIRGRGFMAKRRNMHYEVLVIRCSTSVRCHGCSSSPRRARWHTHVPDELVGIWPGASGQEAALLLPGLPTLEPFLPIDPGPRIMGSAHWEPPIRDGWIVTDRGRVVACGG